jgi:hypothetical protein
MDHPCGPLTTGQDNTGRDGRSKITPTGGSGHRLATAREEAAAGASSQQQARRREAKRSSSGSGSHRHPGRLDKLGPP